VSNTQPEQKHRTDIPTISEDMTEEQIQEMNDLIDDLW
jgi:hypothetical protein